MIAWYEVRSQEVMIAWYEVRSQEVMIAWYEVRSQEVMTTIYEVCHQGRRLIRKMRDSKNRNNLCTLLVYDSHLPHQP